MQRTWLDLGPVARRVLAVSYLGVVIAAITSGQLAPDHVFGFQMFNESSSLRIRLYREVRARHEIRLVPVTNGTWRARDREKKLHTFHWNDRVRTGSIRVLDRFVHASYGLDAQLFRLEAALHDVAANIPADRETRAFVAVVDTLRNGRNPRTVRFRVVRQ
jgi:hypothetical protein